MSRRPNLTVSNTVSNTVANTVSGTVPETVTVLPSPPTVAALVEGVRHAVACLQQGLSAAGVAVGGGDVQAIARVGRALDAARLAALAKVDADGVAGDRGDASTGAWLSRATRADAAEASRQVDLARSLDDELAATREAMADGALSTDHARVITKVMAGLPGDLTAAERDRIERHLVEQARILDPARLRRTARRALEAIGRPAEEVDAHHGAALRDEEDRARARTRLTMHDNGDGTTTGHFTVPTLAASMLRKIVEQMTAPRRRQTSRATDPAASPTEWAGSAFNHSTPNAPDPGTRHPAAAYTGSDGTLDGKGMATDWAHAQGLAFASLLERLPTDHLSHKVAATIVATLDADALATGVGAATLDTGEQISAGQARRLACAAGIVPAVLGTDSVPLDLGRATRLFSQAQRVALATLYDTCAADGCDRPYAWCELHHLTAWAHGGTTTLDNAVPLCSYHHHRIDDPAYRHTITTDARGAATILLRRRT